MGAIVVNADVAGGPIIAIGQMWMTLGGRNVAVLGDPVTGHGMYQHAAPTMVQGSPWFAINGKPVVRQGDSASCGDTATASQTTWTIP